MHKLSSVLRLLTLIFLSGWMEDGGCRKVSACPSQLDRPWVLSMEWHNPRQLATLPPL